MTKRLLDCSASDLAAFTKQELLASIAGSEGRVLAAECIGITHPLLGDVTNAEFAASMGADILLLNMFDVKEPVVKGLPQGVSSGDTVRELKRLTGRVIGINLEPVEDSAAAENAGTLWEMTPGRKATVENAGTACEMGVQLLVLTGNPGNGVSNKAITDSLKAISGARDCSGNNHGICEGACFFCARTGSADHNGSGNFPGRSRYRYHKADRAAL